MERATALYNLFKEIFLLLDDGDRRLLARYDLTVPRFHALLHLGEQPGLSVSELSSLMFCDKSNVTRLIQGMEAENLVRRRRHESDGRVLCLYLTPAGEALREQVFEMHQKRNDRRFNGALAEGEREVLFSALNRLKAGLEHELEGARPLGER